MDIEKSRFPDRFVDHMMMNRSKTPLEISFLTDCLQIASWTRRAQRSKAKGDELPELSDDMEWLGISAYHAGKLAPQSASALFWVASLKKASRLLNLNVHETMLVDPLVMNIYTPDEMRGMDLMSAALGSSGLRIDEMRDTRLLMRLMRARFRGDSSTYHFNTRYLKQLPPGVSDELHDINLMVEHEARIGCPVRFIRFAFERILGIMTEIYLHADQTIKSFAE
jgi:hypothetical protein